MKRLYRSSRDKQIAGICGGLGEYLNVDSNLIRILMILFFVLSGFVGIIVYLIAWLIIPSDDAENHTLKKLYRSSKDKKIAGICGGLADYLGHDATFIRLIFVMVFILTGFIPMLIFYLLAWVILPKEEEIQSSEE